VKLCFEVWDGNFESLFAEHSHDLKARCEEMHARVAAQDHLSYSAAPGHAGRLDIECHDVVWITQTGFEGYDYILPTGEVCTCPSSLEGTVALDGWLIGTLPFGAKYGYISPGELVVRFSKGQVAEVSGTNRRLCADFEGVLAKLPTLQHVSEVAVGMSHAIARAATTHTAGHLWHERHLGFHIGLGARIPQTPHPELLSTGPHLDLVFKHGALHAADGSEILAW
jgi:leucyl aminopeptidase (aminopeptidase T)